MQRVYIAQSLIDAQLLIDRLDEAGVPTCLFHANASGALGELPVTYPEVWIKRNRDKDKAINVIHRFEAQPQPVMNRRCPTCKEENPSTFEICWQCHAIFPPLTN